MPIANANTKELQQCRSTVCRRRGLTTYDDPGLFFFLPFFIEMELHASRASYASMDHSPIHLHREGIIHTYTKSLCALMETTQGVPGPQEDFGCFCGTTACSLSGHSC